MDMIVMGLAGTKASGKGNVAAALQERGFQYASLSDRVREEAKKRIGETYTTKDLQDIGDSMRQIDGAGVLAKKTLECLGEVRGNVIIDGIRNLGEIDVLKGAFASFFYLVAVDAPQETRFQRFSARRRESDSKTWEEFREIDRRDYRDIQNKLGQQVGDCMNDADFYFWSDYETPDKSKAEFVYGNEGFLNLFGDNQRRPTFDEIFMQQAKVWEKRSTCLRRKVGAVISKDNRGISQGYNGPPRGLRHCSDVGCIRERLNIASGERQELCRASHAESNAIINAGRKGISVVGATMHCTHSPCSDCAKDIIQALTPEQEDEEARLVYLRGYPDEMGKGLLAESRIRVERYRGVSPTSFQRFWN